jgi:hypothetical protein
MKRFSLPFVLVALAAGCSDSHGTDGGTDGAPDGGGDYSACTLSSECVVVPASCCGSCGAATRGDAIAVNMDELSAYRTSVCGEMMGCPACYMAQDPTLVATCDAGRCEVVDLRAEDLTSCMVDTDCQVRTHDCCECGGDVSLEGLIALPLASYGDLMDLVCDEGSSEPCPECAPVYPMEASGVCDDDNHCAIEWAGGP